MEYDKLSSGEAMISYACVIKSLRKQPMLTKENIKELREAYQGMWKIKSCDLPIEWRKERSKLLVFTGIASGIINTNKGANL